MAGGIKVKGRPLFRAAMAGTNRSGRPPLWVMRQAGRYLPEYRKLKQKHSFLEMVRTPELAVEVTMQPLRRFELDAAIVFSDILVIPEAMGQPYDFRNGGGIEMTRKLTHDSCIEALESNCISEKLSYVGQALTILREELGDKRALLGFCGSPWTLACYMLEGGSAEGFPKTLDWARRKPASFERLLEKITLALTDYLHMQASCGVDALQIFDSWHSLCPSDKVWDWSLKWIRQLIVETNCDLPVIAYANAPLENLPRIARTGAKALGIHHNAAIDEVRKRLPMPMVLQGNLDPAVMEAESDKVERETKKILEKMRGDTAHVMNLGHGIRPAARIECMQTLVSTVRTFAN